MTQDDRKGESGAVATTTTTMLRRAIARAIALDGGASLVTSLKDYLIPDVVSSNKRLNNLLVQSLADEKLARRAVEGHGKQPKAKLLTFLELQSDLFHVDRNEVPHWVSLLNTNDNGFFLSGIFQETAEYITTEHGRIKQEDLRGKLFEKIVYVIRRNHARTERRRAKQQVACDDFQMPSVTLLWLLRECTWEFHFFARECGIYLPGPPSKLSSHTPSSISTKPTPIYQKYSDVKKVGSKEWESVVIYSLEQMMMSMAPSTIVVAEGRVFLHDNELKKVEDQEFPQRVSKLLTEIVVVRDGGHKVSLSLLLTRYDDIRLLLGGRDLLQLYQQHSGLFQKILITQVDHDLILQSRHTETTKPSAITENGPANDTVEVDRTKRMMVDEVGLYSIANGKWGKAMANILIRSTEKTNLYADRVEERMAFPSRVAIDLTAGVGGMTLGLAKSRFFDKVIAVEIDSSRAKLCQENMVKHSLEDVVEVTNTDSNLIISKLPKRSCIVIDCPWGGYGYKKGGGDIQLFLGNTPLDGVVENIVRHCTPCIIGLRLPVTFGVDIFLQSLERSGLALQCMSINKLQVQLFVVLHSSSDSA
jgi:RNA cap guanine-N2 methyltransferase